MRNGLLILVFFSIIGMNAQSIEQNKWDNRLVVILASKGGHSMVKEQKDLLAEDIAGLKERKLKVILATPGAQQEILPEEGKMRKSTIYTELNGREDFQIFLIGLDGGVKLSQNEILTRKKLYATIDSMPMRQAEMKKQ